MSSKTNSSFGMFHDEFDKELMDLNNGCEKNDFDLNNPFNLEQYEESRKLDGFSEDVLFEKNQDEALRRLSYIKYLEKHNSKGWTEKNIKPLLEGIEESLDGPLPSWRTVVSWRKVYMESGHDLSALIPRHSRKGNRNIKKTSESKFYWEAVNKKYLTRERSTISSTYKYYKDCVIHRDRFNLLSRKSNL